MVLLLVSEPGEHMETIVFDGIARDMAQQLGSAATDWLVAQGTIEPSPWRNIFGEPTGHTPGPTPEVTHHPQQNAQYGWVEIWASGEGVIVVGGEPPIVMGCPTCRARQPTAAEVISAWEKTAEAAATCRTCRRNSDITQWDGGTSYAFTRLSVSFFQWPPVTDAFKKELSNTLGNFRTRTIRARA